jgi:5-oxoprolinase (ATP-hydrolysing) subunit A
MRIDLNADVGESVGAMSTDSALMQSITSANIAAGFHGGDPSVLRETVRMARAHGVAVGAHPGFPDRDGFGRRELHLTPQETEDLILYQLAAVAGVAAAEGVRLQHVKAHGALYNMAARDRALAGALARAVAVFDRSLILFALPHSEVVKAGRQLGLRVAAEAFADRAYEPDGSLVSRQKTGAVLCDADLVAARALRLATEGSVAAIDGSVLRIEADTLCVHGDTPGADQLAAKIRAGLAAGGIVVKAVGAA